jgi:hypothetical protein
MEILDKLEGAARGVYSGVSCILGTLAPVGCSESTVSSSEYAGLASRQGSRTVTQWLLCS